MEKLTLQQAIEQGYTKFLYKGEKFQSLRDLASIEDADYEKGIELVNKEPETIGSYIDAEQMREWVAEQSECQHSDETGDDTNQVYDTLMELPLDLFAPIIKAVNEKMKGIGYYKSSGIDLVK